MSMPKGKYHYVNGKLRRKYKKNHDPKVHHLAMRRKVVHNGELVASHELEQPHAEVGEIVPVRLEAILNSLWSSMSLGEKVMAMSTRYFDPSNPSGI